MLRDLDFRRTPQILSMFLYGGFISGGSDRISLCLLLDLLRLLGMQSKTSGELATGAGWWEVQWWRRGWRVARRSGSGCVECGEGGERGRRV